MFRYIESDTGSISKSAALLCNFNIVFWILTLPFRVSEVEKSKYTVPVSVLNEAVV